MSAVDAMLVRGTVHKPKVKEMLVIDLRRFGNSITYDEVMMIVANTDWRFKWCMWYPKSKVRKVMFERLT